MVTIEEMAQDVQKTEATVHRIRAALDDRYNDSTHLREDSFRWFKAGVEVVYREIQDRPDVPEDLKLGLGSYVGLR